MEPGNATVLVTDNRVDIWIGDPEENKGWEWLKETRHFLVERIARDGLPPERVAEAWWEIYAAEGSDWFWWYGPDFTIDTDFLFDELFLHQTASDPAMTQPRYAIENWFFGASQFPGDYAPLVV